MVSVSVTEVEADQDQGDILTVPGPAHISGGFQVAFWSRRK